MRFHALPACCLLALFAAGCGSTTDPTSPASTTPTPASGDQAEVLRVMQSMPQLAESDLFMSEEETELSFAAEAALGHAVAPTAAIRPWRYWRTIKDVERRFEFEFFAPDSNGDPTRAIVTVHKFFSGTFNIATPTPAPGDSSETDAVLASSGDPPDLRIVRKRLHDHWIRRVALARVETEKDARCAWRIAGTSGVHVFTPVPTTTQALLPRIQSLRIVKADLDTTITNPLELFRLRQIIHATPGEEVKLTVTTTETDDVVVLLHRGHRFRFENNGDGTHSGTWRVPEGDGVRLFGVNALSHGTLFDDELPYRSDAWILPYVAKRMETDYLPE